MKVAAPDDFGIIWCKIAGIHALGRRKLSDGTDGLVAIISGDNPAPAGILEFEVKGKWVRVLVEEHAPNPPVLL